MSKSTHFFGQPVYVKLRDSHLLFFKTLNQQFNLMRRVDEQLVNSWYPLRPSPPH